MTRPPAFRFFVHVSPPAAPLTAVLGVLALGGAALEAVEQGSSDWVLASIGLIQLFAASTGFTRHASRGYYDPVLLGSRRASIAIAHFAAATAPGAIAWIACGAAQAVAARSIAVPAFSPAGWTALFIMSAIPWSASVRAAPFLGGALWIFLSISLVASGRILESLARLHVDRSWALEHPLRAFGVGFAFPYAIPSLRWPGGVLLAFAAAGLVALAGGVLAIARGEFPLAEEGS